MSDQHGKVLSFGPFELSVGNRLLTNGTKVIPLGARAMDLLIVLAGPVPLQRQMPVGGLGRSCGVILLPREWQITPDRARR